MKPFLSSWQFWAVLSAVFAALTAVFAKVGVQNINSDFATFIRSIVIIGVLGAILTFTREWQPIDSITSKTWVFLALSGLATGASWLCYFRALQLGNASQVAPIDKLSIVLVALFGALFLGESLSSLGWVGVILIAFGSFLVATR
jgi:transporter family protein